MPQDVRLGCSGPNRESQLNVAVDVRSSDPILGRNERRGECISLTQHSGVNFPLSSSGVYLIRISRSLLTTSLFSTLTIPSLDAFRCEIRIRFTAYNVNLMMPPASSISDRLTFRGPTCCCSVHLTFATIHYLPGIYLVAERSVSCVLKTQPSGHPAI